MEINCRYSFHFCCFSHLEGNIDFNTLQILTQMRQKAEFTLRAKVKIICSSNMRAIFSSRGRSTEPSGVCYRVSVCECVFIFLFLIHFGRCWELRNTTNSCQMNVIASLKYSRFGKMFGLVLTASRVKPKDLIRSSLWNKCIYKRKVIQTDQGHI